MERADVVVVAAGPGPRVEVGAPIVIAADGGLDRALALGLDVTVVVGDLDSASPRGLAEAEARGARMVRHPTRKDATDLELALDEAAALGATRILVVASAEGRLDHLLGSVLLLASDRYASIEIDALVGSATLHVIRGARRLAGEPGEVLSLFPLAGPARITTDGLEYPLTGEVLEPGSTRGVSNVFLGSTATVTVTDGVALAVRSGGDA